jgi:hypothetical protein
VFVLMANESKTARKRLQSPVGCEGYLTRRQAALALGFASEFKIREFERQGMLRSVRGPMRAAFYPRPEILALKAQLALSEPGQVALEPWTDAELLALLVHPKRTGEARTVFDLVMETQISIERAECIHDFWSRHASMPARDAEVKSTTGPSEVDVQAAAKATAHEERRGGTRLSRDSLIHNLRDPDPRIREAAFIKLKESEI